MKPRRRGWRIAVRVALVAAMLLVGLTLDLLFRYPSFDRSDFPVAAGATGDGFRIVDVDGVPLALQHGLPFPSDFDRTERAHLDLGGRWELRLDPDERGRSERWFEIGSESTGWQSVTVPSTYNAFHGPHPDHQGVTWFRHRFAAPTDESGSTPDRWRLAFRGVLLRAEVWLNGELLGGHEGGYTPFYFDVTGRLQAADNWLVVRADNRSTPTSLPPLTWSGHRPGWAPYGGIYRDVYLERLAPTYLAKAAATPRLETGERGQLELELVVHSHGRQAHTVAVTLLDPDGTKVAEGRSESDGDVELVAHRLRVEVPSARPWSPAAPELYELELELSVDGRAVDRVALATGLRRFAATESGLELNGSPTRLLGIAKHEDHPTLGASQTEELVRSDFELIRAMGANYVRLSHYPHGRAVLEHARDNGVLLSEEIALYQAGLGWVHWAAWDRRPWRFPYGLFGLRQLHHPTLLRNAQQQLVEMIERDRNNPAVVLWSVGNESYSLLDGSRPVYAWLRDVVRAFDDSRPVTYSEITFGAPPLDALRRAADEMDVVSVNFYPGWYYGEPGDAADLLDDWRARLPDRPVVVSECGAGAALGRTDADGPWPHLELPMEHTFSESYQADLLHTLWLAADARPYVAGFSPWVFSDFRCPWFPLHPVPGYNLKGVVTRERELKQGYHVLREAYTGVGNQR